MMLNMTTGMLHKSGSDLRADNTDHPSVCGIITSKVIKAGLSSRAILRPALPSMALRMINPSGCSVRSINRCTLGSSSITRRHSPSSAVRSSPGKSVGSGAEGASTSTGRVSVNVEPLANSLSTDTVPFIISAKCLVMVNPSPVPPYLRDVEDSPCVNASNNFSSCSCDIPMPSSITTKLIVNE